MLNSVKFDFDSRAAEIRITQESEQFIITWVFDADIFKISAEGMLGVFQLAESMDQKLTIAHMINELENYWGSHLGWVRKSEYVSIAQEILKINHERS